MKKMAARCWDSEGKWGESGHLQPLGPYQIIMDVMMMMMM